jgi:hypothetical protein
MDMRSISSRWSKLILVAAAVGACSSGGSVPTQTGDPAPSARTLSVGVGETASVPGSDVTITFRSVTEDSRCPLDVTCVWEGNGRVALTLSSADGSEDAELNTTVQPRRIDFAGMRVVLASLAPYPAGEPIDPDDYVATFEIED